MQWHWGNIGSAVQGLAALGVAVAAIIGLVTKGPDALRAWTDRQRAQAEAAREQAETERASRLARLNGWSAHDIDSFSVQLVKDSAEVDRARDELASGDPTAYAVLRVTSQYENRDTEGGRNLRRLVEESGYVARCPTAGEKEALRRGLEEMGIPRSPLA